MPPQSKKMRQKRMKIALGSIGVLAIILIITGIALSPLSPFYSTTTTPTANTSTISLISYPDGEDVSNFVEVGIWVPTSTATFDTMRDVLTLSHYQLLGTVKSAEDISLDFSIYEYIFIEIDPNAASFFQNDFHLITNPTNREYTYYVYQLASDVNFNMVDSTTMANVSIVDYQTDGNYTVVFDVPHFTQANIHANDDPNWAVTENQWDDMSASAKAYYYDEANFRCEATLYDPVVASNAAKDNMDLKFSGITSTFAFKIVCNGTVGSDDSVTGMNMTIDDTKITGNVYRINAGAYIYLAFDSTFNFVSGIKQLGLEIQFGANLTLSNMYSGRLTIPSHLWDTSGLSFSALSAIGA